MQQAHNEDAIILPAVKEHVLLFFKAIEAGANPIAWPAQQRVFREQVGAGLHCAEVAFRLGGAPRLERVNADSQQVCAGAMRKARAAQG